MFLCNTDEDPRKQGRYLESAIGKRVDGVLIAPCHHNADTLRVLRDRAIPTVTIDRHLEGWDVDSVLGDRSAARAR